MSAPLDDYARHAVLSPPDQEAKARFVQRLFDSIAPRYDLVNHLLSLGLDLAWRIRASAVLDARDGERILDLCAGTGDLALEVARAAACRTAPWSPAGDASVGNGRLAAPGNAGVRVAGSPDEAARFDRLRIHALDFSRPMLARFAAKQRGSEFPLADLICGDGMTLPFAGASFDGACCAFGVRNLADPRAGLSELSRVLKPGGRLVILDFSRPGGLFGLIYDAYFRWVLPLVGALASGVSGAYSYLPASVVSFPEPGEFARWIEASGFTQVSRESLTGGIVTLYSASRAADRAAPAR